MPRFVLLEHAGSPRTAGRTHYDLMLEVDGRLKTWELENIPKCGVDQAATPLPDHRLAYLEFEGELNGDRGRVTRVDAGTFDPVMSADTQWVVRLAGQQLRGLLTLNRRDADGNWRAELRLE